MIQFEHINLVVSNIDEMITFYQAAFPHWSIRDQGEGNWHGKPRKWLHFGDNYQYIAMSDNGIGDNRQLEGHQTGLAHFAFVTHNIESIIARLKQAGFTIDKEGSKEAYRKNCYFIDPAGFEVEFVEYLSDVPQQRNSTS